MEEQNKPIEEDEGISWGISTKGKNIIFYIICFILFILACSFPIWINLLCTFDCGFKDYYKPYPWTEVWAVYGGALVSAGIALLILYKQNKKNHEENEANRKQNELQNDFNRKLQINALKYQQKYDWLYKLKNALSDLLIACDINKLQNIIFEINSYYELTNKDEIYKANSNILKTIDNYHSEIKSRYSSFLLLLGDSEEDNNLKILYNDICYFSNILTNLNILVSTIENPSIKKMTENEIKRYIDYFVEYIETKKEKLTENNRIALKIILKENLEKYNYDFYGNSYIILKSMLDYFKRNLEPKEPIIYGIIQYQRNKIDKLLDVEEIKKNLNAN